MSQDPRFYTDLNLLKSTQVDFKSTFKSHQVACETQLNSTWNQTYLSTSKTQRYVYDPPSPYHKHGVLRSQGGALPNTYHTGAADYLVNTNAVSPMNVVGSGERTRPRDSGFYYTATHSRAASIGASARRRTLRLGRLGCDWLRADDGLELGLGHRFVPTASGSAERALELWSRSARIKVRLKCSTLAASRRARIGPRGVRACVQQGVGARQCEQRQHGVGGGEYCGCKCGTLDHPSPPLPRDPSWTFGCWPPCRPFHAYAPKPKFVFLCNPVHPTPPFPSVPGWTFRRWPPPCQIDQERVTAILFLSQDLHPPHPTFSQPFRTDVRGLADKTLSAHQCGVIRCLADVGSALDGICQRSDTFRGLVERPFRFVAGSHPADFTVAQRIRFLSLRTGVLLNPPFAQDFRIDVRRLDAASPKSPAKAESRADGTISNAIFVCAIRFGIKNKHNLQSGYIP
ncbi:hypothetical protein B0H14DRAFT_2655529 [Mycena olivaceomarginata]|nr:hypothetical protein B0H14DRAFT_2655529 [Mycena olivaceomarginata]